MYTRAPDAPISSAAYGSIVAQPAVMDTRPLLRGKSRSRDGKGTLLPPKFRNSGATSVPETRTCNPWSRGAAHHGRELTALHSKNHTETTTQIMNVPEETVDDEAHIEYLGHDLGEDQA